MRVIESLVDKFRHLGSSTEAGAMVDHFCESFELLGKIDMLRICQRSINTCSGTSPLLRESNTPRIRSKHPLERTRHLGRCLEYGFAPRILPRPDMSSSSSESGIYSTGPKEYTPVTTPDIDQDYSDNTTDELIWPHEEQFASPRYIYVTDSAVNRYFANDIEEYVMSPVERAKLDEVYFTSGYIKFPSIAVNQALAAIGSWLPIGTTAYYLYWQRCRGRITNNWNANIPLLYTLEADEPLAVEAFRLLRDSLSWDRARPGDCVTGCGWNENRRVQWFIDHDLLHAIAEDLLRSGFSFFGSNGPDVDISLAALVLNGLCYMLGIHRGLFRTYDGDNPCVFSKELMVIHRDTMFPVPQKPFFERLLDFEV
ncbi:hypothetical protein KEM54_003816 [Ascosphaera aggregata]|nr:hypothetical protein KEM54_003816 [Ascosphaera aggregata]